MKQLVIFGAGGHAKVVADIAAVYYDDILFFENVIKQYNDCFSVGIDK